MRLSLSRGEERESRRWEHFGQHNIPIPSTMSKRLPRSDSAESTDVEAATNGLASRIRLPQLRPATKEPKQTLQAVYSAGRYKAGLTLDVLAIQTVMAGIYIAAAGQLLLSVGGGLLGAALFPTGLIAVVLTSAELFTGDSLIFVASVAGGQVKLRSLLRNWIMAWLGNLVGSLAWAVVMGYLSTALEDIDGAVDFAIRVAEKKAHETNQAIFIRGIGANFLVCVAVWQATTAEEVAGKVLALWFPVTAFILMGFDHVVANMYLIPMGMMLGADVSVGRLVVALLLATAGNVVGGGIFVGAVYWYVFDSMAKFNAFRKGIRQGMSTMRRSIISHMPSQHVTAHGNEPSEVVPKSEAESLPSDATP